MGDNELDEEAVLMWQDTLDEIAVGRPRNLRCPFCAQGEIMVTTDEQTKRTRVECLAPKCKHFIEVKIKVPVEMVKDEVTKKPVG